MTSISAPTHERRWLILAVIGLAQLMVLLDVTVVNIAMPSAQHALGFSDDARQWLITAYTLSFGGLLLFAGRVGDLVGRKRAFTVGLAGFAAASALSGAAHSFGVLIAGRALQGAFGALLAPAALSLLTTTFSEGADRAKAFGIFGAVGVGGGALGVLVGGLLTEYLSWRWCMYINIVIALPVGLAAFALLPSPAPSPTAKLDVAGTLSACLGLVALVFGFAQAESHGWGSTSTLACIALGVIVLAVFIAIQRRSAHPLLPLRIVLDRSRGGALLAIAVNFAALIAVFVFLVYYLQQNLGQSAAISGLAFLPSPVTTAVAATLIAPRLAGRWGPGRVICAGLLIAAAGMVLLAQLGAHSSYVTNVLPGMVVMAFGMGCVVPTSMATATHGVHGDDAGVAGATVNTMQQVGGSLGTALLSTIAVSATSHALAAHPHTAQVAARAAAHGYTTAFWCSAALLAAGALIFAALISPASTAAAPDSDRIAQPALH